MVSSILFVVLIAMMKMPQAAEACNGVNGPCDNTTACCPPPIGANMVFCIDNMCDNILDELVQDLLIISASATPIIGALPAYSIPKVGGAFLNAYGHFTLTGPVSFADLYQLGTITIGQSIDLLRITAPHLTFSFPTATLQTLPVGNFARYLYRIIAVAKTQSHTTFGDVDGFRHSDFGDFALIRISDFADVVADFIARLGNLNHVFFAELSSVFINAGLDAITFSHFLYIGPSFEFTIDDIAADGRIVSTRLRDMIDSLRDNNTCLTDDDCCQGDMCSCCAPVGAGGSNSCCTSVANTSMLFGNLFGVETNDVCANLCPDYSTVAISTARTSSESPGNGD